MKKEFIRFLYQNKSKNSSTWTCSQITTSWPGALSLAVGSQPVRGCPELAVFPAVANLVQAPILVTLRSPPRRLCLVLMFAVINIRVVLCEKRPTRLGTEGSMRRDPWPWGLSNRGDKVFVHALICQDSLSACFLWLLRQNRCHQGAHGPVE